MPSPTPSDLHVDGLLTNISIGYLQSAANFVADRVFPRVPVQKQSDKYATFDRGDFFRDEMEQRGLASESAGIGYSVSNDNYQCEDWALHIDVDDRQVANADTPFAPRQNAAQVLTQKELIKREREWAAAFFGTGVWGTDWTAGSDFTAFDDDASDVIETFADAAEIIEDGTGLMPNTLVTSRKGFHALKNHPDIVARIVAGGSASAPATVSQDAVAAVLGLDRILVAGGVYNTAGRGETASMSRIVGNHALLCHVAPTPGLMTPTAGLTFVWSGYIGSVEGRRILRYRIEERHAERVEIEANWDQKVVAPELGLFMSNVAA